MIFISSFLLFVIFIPTQDLYLVIFALSSLGIFPLQPFLIIFLSKHILFSYFRSSVLSFFTLHRSYLPSSLHFQYLIVHYIFSHYLGALTLRPPMFHPVWHLDPLETSTVTFVPCDNLTHKHLVSTWMDCTSTLKMNILTHISGPTVTVWHLHSVQYWPTLFLWHTESYIFWPIETICLHFLLALPVTYFPIVTV